MNTTKNLNISNSRNIQAKYDIFIILNFRHYSMKFLIHKILNFCFALNRISNVLSNIAPRFCILNIWKLILFIISTIYYTY